MVQSDPYAVIEIGSRAVRLLIATSHPRNILHIVMTGTEETRLREAMNVGGEVYERAIVKTIDSVRAFSEKAARQQVKAVRIVGTEVLRSMDNQSLDRIRQSADDLQIMTPAEEAYMSLVAAIKGLDDNAVVSEAQVLDAGAGSTEYASGTHTNGKIRLLDYRSFPLGLQELANLVAHYKGNVQLIKEHVRTVVNNYGSFGLCAPVQAKALALGSGATKVAWYFLKGSGIVTSSAYSPKAVHGQEITLDLLNRFVKYAQQNPIVLQARKSGHTDEAHEVQVALIGSILFTVLLEQLGLDRITVSAWGLRYGVVWCMIRPNDYCQPTIDKTPNKPLQRTAKRRL